MSGDVITLGNIVNPKQKAIIRHISDFFDSNRGNVSGNIALTKFGNSSAHTILFNTLSPDLDGKQLISVENNDSVLYAPIEIKSIICNDKRNNDSVNILIEKTSKKRVWEARSDEQLIKLLLRLDDQESQEIAGFSITFADAVRTKYRIGATILNSEDEIISKTIGLDSSFESNNTQFFQFANVVEGANRMVIDIELVGTNIYEWKLNNITLYSHMNSKSLQSLADLSIITYSMYPNNIMMRKSNDDILKVENQGKSSSIPSKKEGEVLSSTSEIEQIFQNTDSFGTPLVAAPNLNHQFFDNLQSAQITKIANIKRLYSTTELKNGKKIYTFETDPNTKNLTLTFSPSDELNRSPDEPVYDMEKLVEKGYIKKGGFKNYCLTFYIKMDQTTMQDQYLVWKNSGWLFNDQLPDLARALDIYIPIEGTSKPQVFTEYKYNFFNEIKENIVVNDVPAPLLPDGKWVAFQFIKQVIDKDNAINTVKINTNPVDENGNFTNKEFKDLMVFTDKSTENHQACTWGGVSEHISVSGSKYISLYGISLYEIDV